MNRLLLIALTNTVKTKIDESSQSIDKITQSLENLDNIRLYRYQTKKDQEKGEDGRIALPFDSRNMLLLKKVSDANYFLAVDFQHEKTLNTQSTDAHELPSDVSCQITEKTKCYLDDAIDHNEVANEVSTLEPWKPFESSNIEEKKWLAYFDLYKKIIGENKVDFILSDITHKDKKLFAISSSKDKDLKNKVTDARGKDIQFSLNSNSNQQKGRRNQKSLGQLRALHTKIEIQLHDDYKKKLYELITNQKEALLLKDGVHPDIRLLSSKEFEEKTKQSSNEILEEISFYLNDSPCFKAKALQSKQDRSSLDVKNPPKITLHINKNTIVPLQLHCSIDYFSEEYQVDVMERAFDKVKNMDIWDVLSGNRVSKLPHNSELKFDNPKLNKEQKKAIQGAVDAEELFLIWGPPGTGKTEVIKEIAKKESIKGNKTLITSQSNLAVDNALARIYGDGFSYPFRIAREGYKLEGEDGQKVPFLETVPHFSLSSLKNKVEKSENDSFTKKYLQDIKKAERTVSKKNKSATELREFKQLAQLYYNKINVVGATLMETGKTINKGNYKKPNWKNKLLDTIKITEFDTIIVDEVSKAAPPELFIPIPLGKKLILVGDHKQLPPMFKMLSGDDKPLEQWAEEVRIPKEKLDIKHTIFERLWNRHTDDAAKCRAMLTQQYRMHSDIRKLIEPFYTDTEGSLTDGLSDDEIGKLRIDDNFFGKVAMWIGTQGYDSEKGGEKEDGTSYYNEDEIEKVGKLLDKLVALKDPNMSVGIITFYGAQLRKLKKEYNDKYKEKFGDGKLIFGTVDRFQGRECDVIICSLVRNNKRRDIGFASKVNRINVGFSRARRCLIILGSKEQFAYESKNKNAQEKYKYIYDNCKKVKPKELEK